MFIAPSASEFIYVVTRVPPRNVPITLSIRKLYRPSQNPTQHSCAQFPSHVCGWASIICTPSPCPISLYHSYIHRDLIVRFHFPFSGLLQHLRVIHCVGFSNGQRIDVCRENNVLRRFTFDPSTRVMIYICPCAAGPIPIIRNTKKSSGDTPK